MGSKSSTLSGSTQHKGNIDMLTKLQRKEIDKVMKGLGGPVRDAYKDFLREPDQPRIMSRGDLAGYLRPSKEAYQNLLQPRDTAADFQRGVVDPLMQQYTKNVLPAIQQRFVDQNASSSSALNAALGESGRELGTQLGQYYLPYMQGQQQTQLAAAQGMAGLTTPRLQYAQMQQGTYDQALTNRLSGLSGVGGMLGAQTFTPMVHNKPGILGPMISAGGQIGAAAMAAPPAAAMAASSETVKENIHDYEGGLDKINNLKVKQYDYIESFGGAKNKVGLIAEKVPIEIQAQVNGVLGVDVYGLVSILVNAVKELSMKVDRLEKLCHNQ